MQEICLTTMALHSLQSVVRELYPFAIFEKRVQVDVKSLKRKPDLISHLDERRTIVQITITHDGVTVYMYGTATELARYPDVTRVGSIVVLGQLAYFSGTPSISSQRKMYRCRLETGEVEPAFRMRM